MDTYSLIRLILLIIFLAGFCFILLRSFFKDNPLTTRFIARTAIFAALSIILYSVPVLKFPLPIFPSFLEIHLDEIPAFIAGFAYGPLSGVLVILTKTIVKLPLTTTACVGEFADFIYSIAFVLPATLLYKKFHTLKGAIVSLAIATVIQLVVACFVTTFIMLDIYGSLFNLSRQTILMMCQAVNPVFKSINDVGVSFLFMFLLMVALPFNLIKDIIVVLVTMLLYKRLRILFNKKSTKKLGQ